jgi:hypothetical protein
MLRFSEEEKPCLAILSMLPNEALFDLCLNVYILNIRTEKSFASIPIPFSRRSEIIPFFPEQAAW